MNLFAILTIFSLLLTSFAWASCEDNVMAFDKDGVWFQPMQQEPGSGRGIVYRQGSEYHPGGMWARTTRSWEDVLKDSFVFRDRSESRQTIEILNIENLLDKKVLDLGCGNGDAVWDLIRHGIDVEGVDHYLDEEQLKFPEIFHKVNAQKTGLPSGAYDVIIASHSVYYYTAQASVYAQTSREAFRLLKPGGHFVVLHGQRAKGHLKNFEVLEHFGPSFLARKPQ